MDLVLKEKENIKNHKIVTHYRAKATKQIP